MLILAVWAIDAKSAPVIVALAPDCPTRVIALSSHVALARVQTHIIYYVAASSLLLLS